MKIKKEKQEKTTIKIIKNPDVSPS